MAEQSKHDTYLLQIPEKRPYMHTHILNRFKVYKLKVKIHFLLNMQILPIATSANVLTPYLAGVPTLPLM